MRVAFSIACLPILLSGCATKIIREYYTAPERVVYVEPIIQKSKEATSFPVWTIVVITCILSLALFMTTNILVNRWRKS